jgi:hypothetical protein
VIAWVALHNILQKGLAGRSVLNAFGEGNIGSTF